MAGISERAAREQRTMGPLVVLAVVLGLIGLPIAVWLDLRDLSERMLRAQASEISRIIDEMRGFYGSDVVGRVLQADGVVTTTHNYRDVPGAIPIPATLSIELGKRISAHDGSVKYRFVSDLPFKGREPHSARRVRGGRACRASRDPKQPIVEVSGTLLNRHVRAAAPVRHGAGLRQLPQLPSRQPQDGLEGRRRARHPGDFRRPADRRECPLLQVSAGLFRRGDGGRPGLHPPAAPAVGLRPRHEQGARGGQRLPRLDLA